MSVPRWGELTASVSAAPKPFLKWAGGKRQVLAFILPHIPEIGSGATYFEPFVGAGAVFFALAARRKMRAVLGDTNGTLIECYANIRSSLPELLRELDSLPEDLSEHKYYELRENFNKLLSGERGDKRSSIRRTALMIYINHSCFNGLFRTNRDGRFNVPFNFDTHPSVYSRHNLTEVSRALHSTRARLVVGDFARTLQDAAPGDVVYLDPPYDPPDGHGFSQYGPVVFGKSDQERLARASEDLASRGVRVLLSNSVTPLTTKLFEGSSSIRIGVARSVNRDGHGRGQVPELLVVR